MSAPTPLAATYPAGRAREFFTQIKTVYREA
jgi:hypothetical protein